MYFTDADELRALLQELWGCRYRDLYEYADDVRPLGNVVFACKRLVTYFMEHQHDMSHQRLVYMGWACILAVAPTIHYIVPTDVTPLLVLDAIRSWTENSQVSPHNLAKQIPSDVTAILPLDEGRACLKALVQTIYPAHAPQAVLEILDTCLDGQAVLPGSRRKRDLFNWLLVEVAPAAWYLRLPDAIYDILGPQAPGEIERTLRGCG